MTTFARGQRVIGAATHYVDNQPPWRVDVNEYTLNTPLAAGVDAFGGGWADAALREAGALVGSESFQRDAELANIHRSGRLSARPRGATGSTRSNTTRRTTASSARRSARGAHTSAWADPRPGRERRPRGDVHAVRAGRARTCLPGLA